MASATRWRGRPTFRAPWRAGGRARRIRSPSRPRSGSPGRRTSTTGPWWASGPTGVEEDMRVRRADLGQLDPLGEGGYGKVYRVPGYHLPGDPADLAYKEFTQEQAQQAHASGAAVAFRAGLSSAERADLDSYAAWPRALVEHGGVVVGLLMPLIPADFFCELIDGSTGRRGRAPREMQWLIASQAQCDAAEIDLPSVD